MIVVLNNEQEEFLKEQFEICKEDIEKMSYEDWDGIREKCFDIEVDELLTYGESCNTPLYHLVASIIDAKVVT